MKGEHGNMSDPGNISLRVGAVMVSTNVNGPGRRLVIWLQGCEFHCKGCFNPEFHDRNMGMSMSGHDILAMARMDGGIEGLTFSGGEPFLQAEPLGQFAMAAREEGFGIVCYSGYSLEEIRSGKPDGGMELLNQVDLLIDGLYRENEQAPLIWRGSRNQRVHFLTSRYRHLEQMVEKENRRHVEVITGRDSVAVTGIFPLEFWNRLRQKLENSKAGQDIK